MRRSEIMPENFRDEVASLIAIGLLGEIKVMESVGSIKRVTKVESRLESKMKAIEWLPYAFGMKLILSAWPSSENKPTSPGR